MQISGSSSRCLHQDGLEVGVTHCAEQDFGGSACVDDDQSRLSRDAEASKDDARVVADLRERQRVLVDKVLERLVIARPCDANEIDPSGPLGCCCFDRSSFCVTDASSGRPEPECRRTSGAFSAYELAST